MMAKCGYMGKQAVRFVTRLGDIAAEGRRTPNGACVRQAVQLLSAFVQRGGLRCTVSEWAGQLA